MILGTHKDILQFSGLSNNKQSKVIENLEFSYIN